MKVTSAVSLVADNLIIRKNDIITINCNKGILTGRLRKINKSMRKIDLDISEQYRSTIVSIWLSDVISIEKDDKVINVFRGIEILSGITDGDREAFIGDKLNIELKSHIRLFKEKNDHIWAELLNVGLKDIKIKTCGDKTIMLKFKDIEEFNRI